jgi:hypothetical protein
LDKRSSGCLVIPALDTGNLDESVINQLLATEAEAEDLQNVFVFITSQDSSKDIEINGVAHKTLLKTVNFKTPSKLKGQMINFNLPNLVGIVSNFTMQADEEPLSSNLKFESSEELSCVRSC